MFTFSDFLKERLIAVKVDNYDPVVFLLAAIFKTQRKSSLLVGIFFQSGFS